MSTDVPEWGALETLRRGWRQSPELRQGAGLTVVFAMIGAGGRLVIPLVRFGLLPPFLMQRIPSSR